MLPHMTELCSLLQLKSIFLCVYILPLLYSSFNAIQTLIAKVLSSTVKDTDMHLRCKRSPEKQWSD